MGWVHNPTNGRGGLGEGWREERERERDAIRPSEACCAVHNDLSGYATLSLKSSLRWNLMF